MVNLWSLSPRPPRFFGPSAKEMHGTTSGIGVTKEDIGEAVSSLVDRAGRAAEGFARRFDFGVPPSALRRCNEPILNDARRIQQAGWESLPAGPVLRECFAGLQEIAPKTYRKTVARIAGVFAIHAYLRARMTDEGVAGAIAAGSLYEIVQDLLDDLLDGGGWTFGEANRLYNRCLGPLTDTAVSIERLEDDLGELMGPGQDGLEHVLSAAIKELRGLLTSASATARKLVREGHDALARAQAATVYLQREAFDLAALRDIAEGLPSPDASLSWFDRLGIYASWPSNIALFDAGFTSTRVPESELTAHARAWFFYDEAISLLEHFAGAKADARAGIFNLAGIYAHLPRSVLDGGAFPELSRRQLESLFAKATECLVRAIREGIAGGGDPVQYAFLAVMIPTIIFAMCHAPRSEADGFMATLAPAVRSVIEPRIKVEDAEVPC